jgi:mRNA-degrading endonuclease RelE of RelBE toxin-antitoxin system
MVQKYIKTTNKYPPALRSAIFSAVQNILANEYAALDIVKMQGMNAIYRCRIGTVRILFSKNIDGTTSILSI